MARNPTPSTLPGAPGASDPADACTLSPEGLGERMDWIRREILPHAIARLPLEDGLAFELRDAPGVAAKLDHLVALERECCAGVAFARAPAAAAGRLRLEIRGVDPSAAVFRALDVPAAGAAGGTTLARVARAGGAGLLASLVVCCLLPVAAAALLGGAIPALTALDGPIPVAGGALLAGGVAWRWQRRREAHRAAPATEAAGCGPGC